MYISNIKESRSMEFIENNGTILKMLKKMDKKSKKKREKNQKQKQKGC